MAGPARVTQALFSTTGLTPTGGFAAAANGTVTTEAGSSNTPANIMTGQSGEWAAGWLAATLGSSKFPAIEDMNGVNYVLTYQLAYLLERGIPEYDAGTSYNIGDITRQAATGNLYLSLINANLGNALSNGSDWKFCGNIEQLISAPYWCGTSTGSANAQAISTGYSLGALTAGQTFNFTAGFSNSGTITLAIDSVAAADLYYNGGSGLATVVSTQIVVGNDYTVLYDGSKLVVINPTGSLAFVSKNFQVFTSSGTYTPTAGMVYCDIEVVGSGGGGGGVNTTQGTAAGGGGGGGYAKSTFSAATIGASQTVTIGAAGAAGSSGGGNGGAGNQTFVGALIGANGGGGGTGSTTLGPPQTGGGGGAASSGTIQITGTPGGIGMYVQTTSPIPGFGGSAAGIGGGGGQAVSNGGAGTAGTRGGGGSGACNGASSASAGGPGGAGYCIITEYIG
jgi:hypothetical protein